MLTVEQIVSVHKANVETFFGLQSLAFDGVEKLIELNTQAARTALEEASTTIQAAQEMLALHAGLLQPAAEKAASYGRQVYEIAAATGAEVGRVAEATAAD